MSDSLLPFEWNLPRGVTAAFTTRIGGISLPPWNSFNLASHVGDAPPAVAENRARLKNLLVLPAEPRWLNQVHGIEVSNLDETRGESPSSGDPVTADASVTRRAGQVCVVMVADCLPVLFASRDGTVVAAAHAGWRGLAAGVLEATMARLSVSGDQVLAWLGPSISRAHFEVGEEVRSAFVDSDAGAAPCFVANDRGRWQADLPGLARRKLVSLGVTDVSGGHWCTHADPARFYSHRRDGHGGRMAAVIWKG